MKKKCTPWLLLAPILFGSGVFFLIPFFMMLYYSLTVGVTGEFAGLQNYIEVLGSSAFQLAVGNTLRFLMMGVALNILLSFGLALMIQKKLKGSGLFRSILLLPMMVGVAAVVLVVQLLFEEKGMVNAFLISIGQPAAQWLEGTGTFWILLGLYIWKNCGYNTILFIAGLNTIPKEYYEGADMDSASGLQKLRWITLPLMIPTFFFAGIISLIQCFKTYREVLLLCGEHPHESIYMISHFLNNNFNNLNYQRLSVTAILLFVFVTVFAVICYRLQRKYEEIM